MDDASYAQEMRDRNPYNTLSDSMYAAIPVFHGPNPHPDPNPHTNPNPYPNPNPDPNPDLTPTPGG